MNKASQSRPRGDKWFEANLGYYLDVWRVIIPETIEEPESPCELRRSFRVFCFVPGN